MDVSILGPVQCRSILSDVVVVKPIYYLPFPLYNEFSLLSVCVYANCVQASTCIFVVRTSRHVTFHVGCWVFPVVERSSYLRWSCAFARCRVRPLEAIKLINGRFVNIRSRFKYLNIVVWNESRVQCTGQWKSWNSSRQKYGARYK